jgi:hypothetical protein
MSILSKLEDLDVINYVDEEEVWCVNGHANLAYNGRALEQIGECYDGVIHMIDVMGEYFSVHKSKIEFSDFEIKINGKIIK